MTEYIIANDITSRGLSVYINILLLDGWKLQGGVAISVTNGITFYAQALIR